MKQHPKSIGSEPDDEVAQAIEHQYARRLMKSVVRGNGAPRDVEQDKAKARGDKEEFDADMQELREKSGF